MTKTTGILATAALLCMQPLAALAADPSEDLFDLQQLRVKITPALGHLEVQHDGKPVLLMRHQEPGHTIEAPFDLTGRDCPPFCIQPMQLAPGVETIGELELLEYIRRISGGEQNLMLIDSRTENWVKLGTIPGAENIPWTKLNPKTATSEQIAEILELEFGASRPSAFWDFSSVKTLVLFCNGPWCGQAPTNIQALLNIGYPAHKLKWYRGGLQAWEQFGFTTVK